MKFAPVCWGKRRLPRGVERVGGSSRQHLIPVRPTIAKSAARIIFWWVMTPIGLVQAQSAERFLCTRDTDHRIVSVVKTDTAGEPRACRVDYTRNGSTITLWSSKTGYVYCVTKATSLVTKLAGGNYSCKPQSVNALDAP
jgi:hypothetical protein